ncbi:MAG: twin-arginine translocase TatA/TatE family subunit [Vulcanimicrobiaceae bacterium]
MFSLPEMGILGVLALLLFGPEKLPGIMRQVGRVTREIQATSQTFIREMERAADVNEPVTPPPYKPPEYRDDEPPLPEESPVSDAGEPVETEAPTAPPPTDTPAQ